MINHPLLSAAEILQLLRRGRRLPLATQAASNAQSGEQVTDGLGHGMDFADIRAYQAGDNPRRIDWRASARRQQTLLRLYHADTNSPCCIVIDRQSSMRFGSQVRSKSAQAARVAIMLAAANMQAGNSLSALILDNKTQWIEPSSEKSALHKFTQIVSKASPPKKEFDGHSIDWQRISSQLQLQLSSGSSLYIVSDFLSLQAEQALTLRQLGKMYHCHALQIIDPMEMSLISQTDLQLLWETKKLNLNNNYQSLKHQQSHWQEQIETLFRRAKIEHEVIPSNLEDLLEKLQSVKP